MKKAGGEKKIYDNIYKIIEQEKQLLFVYNYIFSNNDNDNDDL